MWAKIYSTLVPLIPAKKKKKVTLIIIGYNYHNFQQLLH